MVEDLNTEGEACMDDSECADGLHCDQNICADPNSGGWPVGSCMSNSDCTDGLVCEENICIESTYL